MYFRWLVCLPSVLPAESPDGVKLELHAVDVLTDRSFPLGGQTVAFQFAGLELVVKTQAKSGQVASLVIRVI